MQQWFFLHDLVDMGLANMGYKIGQNRHTGNLDKHLQGCQQVFFEKTDQKIRKTDQKLKKQTIKTDRNAKKQTKKQTMLEISKPYFTTA